MFKRKDKQILEDTKRIAKGTFVLSAMDENMFTKTYQGMEKSKAESPCKYHIPDWFTIKLIPKDKKTYEFLGSFTDGNGYPIVYKDEFFKILKKFRVDFEEIEENTYKITRNPLN